MHIYHEMQIKLCRCVYSSNTINLCLYACIHAHTPRTHLRAPNCCPISCAGSQKCLNLYTYYSEKGVPIIQNGSHPYMPSIANISKMGNLPPYIAWQLMGVPLSQILSFRTNLLVLGKIWPFKKPKKPNLARNIGR